MKLSRKNMQPQAVWKHASSEEYTAFVRTYARTPDSQYCMLHYYRHFINQYPDLLDWFHAPLTERVGRLYGEDAGQASFPASYEARPYLMFLALREYALFDWDWLLAVPLLRIAPLLACVNLDLGVDKLVDVAVRLGYTWKPEDIQRDLNWSVWRMFMHSHIQSVDEISDDHLAELFRAIHSFEERVDVSLFFGSTNRYQGIVEARRRSLYRLYMVLLLRSSLALSFPLKKPTD